MLLSKSMHVHNQLQALAPCQIACMPILNCMHAHTQLHSCSCSISMHVYDHCMHTHVQLHACSCSIFMHAHVQLHACSYSIPSMFMFNCMHPHVQFHKICPMFTFVHECVQWIVYPCVWIPYMPIYDDVFVHVSMHTHFQIPSFSCNDLLISWSFCQHQSYLHLHIWRWNSLAIFRCTMAKDWTTKKCLQDKTWNVGVSL